MATSGPDLERRLHETLEQIQHHAQQIVDGSFALDPERLSEELLADTARIQDELFQMMSDLAAPAPQAAAASGTGESATMNDLAHSVLGEVLTSLGFPVQTQVCYGADIALPAQSIEPLRAAIRRALLIAANHCGSGGQIAIITCRKDDGALLEVLARAGQPAGASGDEPTVDFRCCSVKEFVRDHGGRLDVKTDADGRLRLILHMRGTTPA
jgi:hypothetical protein